MRDWILLGAFLGIVAVVYAIIRNRGARPPFLASEDAAPATVAFKAEPVTQVIPPEQAAAAATTAPSPVVDAFAEAQQLAARGGTLNAEVERLCIVEGGYPDAWPRHDRCAICGGSDFADAFEKQGFTHKRCRSCDFVFLDPYPTDAVLSAIYNGEYYSKTRELFELPRMRTDRSMTPYTAPLDVIEAMIARCASAEEGDWLDVGGGIGASMALVRQKRPGWRVSLNEFSTRSIALAEELFQLEATADTADQLLAKGRTFDVISSISVLEHISHPGPFIADYARLLKPGGVLALIVPHFTQLNTFVSKSAAPMVTPPFHVSFFQETHLRRILEADGLFARVDIEQGGPPAFSLIGHFDTADHWDISIPSIEDPVPKSLMLRPYPDIMGHAINALGLAQHLADDYFAQTDGRQYLIAFAQVA
jgi:2-polyprenyl-3-methyl-5-hydroxy-6-metoxy-1,4-benzoquinol methylase